MEGKPVQNSIECWVVRRSEDAEDAVLLLHKPASPDIPAGFWQPITGGIKDGETAREACVREICEETGLTIRAEDLHPVPGHWEFDLPHQVIRKELFWVEAPHATIRIEEHDDWCWVPLSSVEADLYWESNRHTWSAVSSLIRR